MQMRPYLLSGAGAGAGGGVHALLLADNREAMLCIQREANMQIASARPDNFTRLSKASLQI